MNPCNLTEGQKAKLKTCKDFAELKSMLSSMGAELTDEQMEAVAGGDTWHNPCPDYNPGHGACTRYML